ncbi:MAG: hypothetical protein QW303_08040, partial [Nitrososphaerota archaeon]
MVENVYHNRFDNEYLVFLYRKYVDHVVSYEGHVERIYNDWVIDMTTRKTILQRLDDLMEKITKIYKTKGCSHFGMKTLSHDFPEKVGSQSDSSSKVNALGECSKNLLSILDNPYTFYQKFREILKLVDMLEHKEADDPFITIREELLTISREYGYANLDKFLKLYFGEGYPYLFKKSELEILEIYNKIFVPLSIDNGKNTKEEETKIIINKIELDYDSLIDNTCSITLSIGRIAKIIFSGYVSADSLNILVRTSHIYSSYLSKIKSDCKNILKKMY